MSHTKPDYTTMEGYDISHSQATYDTTGTGGESGGEVGESGANPHAHVNTEPYDAPSSRRKPPPLRGNTPQVQTRKPYQRNEWVYWASNLSYIGFAMLGGTWLSTKTPFVPLSILLFIAGTGCIILSCLMFIVAPFILAIEWGLKKAGM